MECTVYKVIPCKNSGEKPFYIKVEDSGAFSVEEFKNNQFDFLEDSKLSASSYIMLSNNLCVMQLQKIFNPSQSLIDSIKEENSFSISEIKQFKSCAECNKIGYKLTTQDGTVLYPENIEDFEGFEDKVIKIQFNGQILCVKVETYKYHTKEHISGIMPVENCYKSFSECECNFQPEIDITTGRKVKPEELTNKITLC